MLRPRIILSGLLLGCFFLGVLVHLSFTSNPKQLSESRHSSNSIVPAGPGGEANRDLSSALLNVPLPRRNFSEYSQYAPHNSEEPSKFAFATLLCTSVPDERDPFFAAVQQLVWRILWSDWHSRFPMVVFVCPSTPEYQRIILSGQGAYVKEIALITGVIDESKLHLSRWRDQLTKLNMWKYTEFKKIAFLDSDAFPIANLDDIFDLVPTQNCIKDKLSADDATTLRTRDGAELCQYTFGGTIMSEQDGALNGGVLVFAPSLVWHAKFMRDLEKTDQYNIQTAEQGLLDSSLGFGWQGAFPRHDFTQIYNADKPFYDEHRFANIIRVLHCKLWSPMSLVWAPELNIKWDTDWMAMSRFYDDDIFSSARETGRRKEPLEAWVESQQRSDGTALEE